MSLDLDSILDDCLARLAQGETLSTCLARYPGQAAELEPLLQAATRLQTGTLPAPSARFRAQARTQLYAHMQAHPRQGRGPLPRFSPGLRLASALATLLLAFTLTGTALAQSALPGEGLYSWKLASEQVWRAVSLDPVSVELALAGRRVDEALAVSSDADAQAIALHGYQSLVSDLEAHQDPDIQNRVRAGLKTQSERLKSAGIPLPEDKHAPPLRTPLPNLIHETPEPLHKSETPTIPSATSLIPVQIPGLPGP
jgi:hypothetical protein